MEGVRTSDNTILISTRTKRVLVSTTVYNGAIPNVGLYTSSNVVISDQASNKCVIYATGSISCLGSVTGSASTVWSRNGTDLYPTNAGDSVTAASGTFTSSGNNQYSVRTSSGIKLNAGCIVYSDNSQTCAAPTIATGDVEEASNNNFTGHNTFKGDSSFQDSVYISAASTIGPQGHASAATKSSGTFNNMWMVVASSPPATGTASISFTSLTPGKHYQLRWNYIPQGSDGYGQITFNGDSTATAYDWTYRGVNSNSGAAVIGGDNSDSFCRLHEALADATNGRSFGYCDIMPATDSSAWAVCNTVVEDANPFIENSQASCRYDGSAITSIQFAVSAGTISGLFYLIELITP